MLKVVYIVVGFAGGAMQVAGLPPQFFGVAAEPTAPPALAVSATSVFLNPRPGTCEKLHNRSPSLVG